MSRHELKPRPDQPAVIRAVIGWDRPLQTFFAQVFTPSEAEPEEGEATIWLGTEPGELATPEAAIAIVAPYAIIPDDLSDRLQAEMQATVGIKDGKHQQAAKRRIFGSIH
ncbi:hypothetical protein [Sphingobium sp. CECT 9361]|uniref:hypothetical protein n=1 Tax=Sphingobium sp. CECT 9361 TaxID=2845384 RepID=UPI001E33366E|nr:hypothetical protein [Sphingobium sp. CECT 9361]CAH0356315.1 hypothetical protein SPH9361_04000 [Sphingobium sp. CECT 9361]